MAEMKPKFWKQYRLPENNTGLKTVVMANTVHDIVVIDNLPIGTPVYNLIGTKIIGLDSFKIRIQNGVFKTEYRFEWLLDCVI